MLGAAAGAAYPVMEARAYRLVRHRVETPGPRLSVLHISDTHLGPRKRKLARWLKGLPERIGEPPDLVITTGDLIEDDSGIEPIVDALAGCRGTLGRYYVLGSHDYYQSTLRGLASGVRRLYSGPRGPVTVRPADVARLEAGLKETGWKSLINTTDVVETATGTIGLTGVHDPFMRRHTVDHIRRSQTDRLAIGVMHSPDIVSEWVLAGFDLVLAGHTHGGQVRLPVAGAVVTNCTLPAGLASGVHRIGASRLHVSPGLGTGKFAPLRFLCPPEATLLEIGEG